MLEMLDFTLSPAIMDFEDPQCPGVWTLLTVSAAQGALRRLGRHVSGRGRDVLSSLHHSLLSLEVQTTREARLLKSGQTIL